MEGPKLTTYLIEFVLDDDSSIIRRENNEDAIAEEQVAKKAAQSLSRHEKKRVVEVNVYRTHTLTRMAPEDVFKSKLAARR